MDFWIWFAIYYLGGGFLLVLLAWRALIGLWPQDLSEWVCVFLFSIIWWSALPSLGVGWLIKRHRKRWNNDR